MATQRKTIDIYEIHGFYSCGWECVTAETSFTAARTNIKLYRENEPGVSFKIVKKREKKEAN